MGQIFKIMSKIVENVISSKDEGYDYYGSVVVTVRDTETGEVQIGHADYSPSKSEAEATAEAIKSASDNF